MFTFVVIIYIRKQIMTNMKKATEKNDVISIRVDTKVKSKLVKIANEHRREFSDFLRIVLTDIAENKIKITL